MLATNPPSPELLSESWLLGDNHDFSEIRSRMGERSCPPGCMVFYCEDYAESRFACDVLDINNCCYQDMRVASNVNVIIRAIDYEKVKKAVDSHRSSVNVNQ